MFEAVVDELIGLSDADLVERMRANELERRRGDAEMAAMLAVADRRNLHGANGHRSMPAFCRASFNWSSTEAGRRIGLARAAGNVAGLGQAWIAGHIGLPQAVKLSMTHANKRVTDRLGEFAPQLLVHAEQMPYSDFASVVDRFVEQADQDGAHDIRDEAVEGRTARVVGVGGVLDVRASGGDGLITAELMAIFDRFVDIEFRSDLEQRRLEHGDECAGIVGLARTDRQRRFDALVAIFRSAGATDIVGAAAEPLVNIVIDAATWGRMLQAADLASATNLDGQPIDPFTGLAVTDTDNLLDDLTGPTARTCETSNGVTLHTHDVLRAALTGHVRRMVVDAERVVIDMGRRQRLFTGNARRAAKLLVAHCEHIGCELPADWCEIDHVDEWERDRGGTDQSNAALLCRYHNNHKHHDKWQTKRANNGSSYTIRADGTIVLPVGARPPDFVTSEHLDDLDDFGFGDDCGHGDPARHWFDEDPAERARMESLVRKRFDDMLVSR